MRKFTFTLAVAYTSAVKVAPLAMDMAALVSPHSGRYGAVPKPDWYVARLFWSPDGHHALSLVAMVYDTSGTGNEKEVVTLGLPQVTV
jgi:hypothetical protein